jgi:hypothetical protein
MEENVKYEIREREHEIVDGTEQTITVSLGETQCRLARGTKPAPNRFQWWFCAQDFQKKEDSPQPITIKCLVENREKLAGYCVNIPLHPNMREPG